MDCSGRRKGQDGQDEEESIWTEPQNQFNPPWPCFTVKIKRGCDSKRFKRHVLSINTDKNGDTLSFRKEPNWPLHIFAA